MSNAGERLVGFFERDQDAQKSIASDVVAGTIDGVDNPAAAAGTGLARSLLSEDAVVGEFALDGFADETLVFFVGNGHRRCIRFRLDANAARANVRRVLSSHGGDTSGKFEFSLVVHRLP